MNKMLKSRENPKSAAMQIQNQYPSVKKPLVFKSTSATVRASLPVALQACMRYLKDLSDEFKDRKTDTAWFSQLKTAM